MKDKDQERIERMDILKALKASLSKHDDSHGLMELLKRKAEIDREIEEKFFRERTVVDIDVQGSTRMKEGENQQDIFETFAAYQDMVKGVVEANGGDITATAGDGVVAGFDDPNAACKAARVIKGNMDIFNRTKNKLKSPVQIRIGINTGKVMIDPQEELAQIVDATLDVAKQLQKESEAGDILITESTYKLLNDQPAFEALRFWEAEHIHLYRCKKGIQKEEGDSIPASVLEQLPSIRLTPLIDPIAGAPVMNLSPGMRVWMKRSDTVYAESVVRSVKSLGDGHCLVIVRTAGGSKAWCSPEDILKICIADDRAQTLAEQARGAKVRLERLGWGMAEAGGRTAVSKWALMGAAVAVGIILLGLLLKR